MGHNIFDFILFPQNCSLVYSLEPVPVSQFTSVGQSTVGYGQYYNKYRCHHACVKMSAAEEAQRRGITLHLSAISELVIVLIFFF